MRCCNICTSHAGATAGAIKAAIAAAVGSISAGWGPKQAKRSDGLDAAAPAAAATANGSKCVAR